MQISLITLTRRFTLTSRKRCFKDTHQEPERKKPTVRVRQSLARRNDAKNEHVQAEEDIRLDARQPHDHVAGDFNQDERNEEDPETGVVAVGRHVEALFEAFDASICDCGTLARNATMSKVIDMLLVRSRNRIV